MKSAKKILSVFLAVFMLFSVMSVGFSSIAASVAVGSQTGNDTYESTDEVIICVPETIYMTPGDGESVKGQYYVNNTVNSSGVVSLAAEKENGWGSISIYAPGSTAFSFTATGVTGGIGDPIIGSANTSGTSTYEGQRWQNTDLGGTTGYVSYSQCALYINGKGLTFGQTALIEWKVTVYYGNDDTTGKSYYAYTTLYMPGRSVGAIAEAKRSDGTNNEISSWITGVTGVGSQTRVTTDRAEKAATGYFLYDPLWTNQQGGGSYNSANDFVVESDSERYVHASAPEAAGYTFSAGYTGYLSIDGSRYTNTNQVPNFYIGSDALRVESSLLYYGLGKYYVWSILGNGNETTSTDQDYNPGSSAGWTQLYFADEGKVGRLSWNPSYAVSDIAGKYLHIGSQGRANYLSQYDYANAYTSVTFSVTDKSDLRAAVIQATSLDETKYTTASWRGARDNVIEAFQEALRDAANVLGNPAAAQGSIDAALANLKEYMDALKVTVTFDAETNGGMFTDGEVVKEYNIRFGTATKVNLGAALLNYFPVAKFGYEFIGWSLDPDDPKTASLTSIPNITFGTTLYAHYAKTIAVDFHYLADVKGNTDVRTESLKLYNNEDKALDVNVVDADDVGVYTFAGWTLDPTSTEGEDLSDTLTGVTDNAAYYATYVKELMLTLDANGGNPALDVVTGGVYYNYDLTQSTGDAIVTLPKTEPTRAGHGFEGWMIGGKVYQPGDEVTFSGNTTEATATAVWGAETYDVTFNFKNEDGKDVSLTQKVEYGQSAVAPEIPEYYANSTMHYKFLNWSDSFDVITGDTVINAMYENGTMHNFTTTGTPNCEETVDVVYTCSECGYHYTITFEAGHNYVVTDSKDADCENDGYKVYTCQRDVSHTYTEIIKATGHSFENTVYVAPTCTEDGYYVSGTCSNCGEDLAGKTIPALGHSWVVETEATCDTDGLKVCTGYTDENGIHHDCDATEVIPAFGHDYEYVIIAPNCTKDGKTVYTCSTCSHSYEVVLPATGHSYATIIFAPTCTSEGYTSQTCMVCGHSTKTDIVPATGHDYVATIVDPTCTAQGYTKHTCSVCNYTYKTDYVDAIGHDYSIETVVAPTCTTKGYTLHECANCGSSYKTDYVDANGHDYKFVQFVSATNTQNAYDLYKCGVCGVESRTYYYGDKTLLCKTIKDTAGNLVAAATIIFTNVDTGKQIVVETDRNGYFTEFIQTGEYTVTISTLGYTCSETGTVTVGEFGTLEECTFPSVEKNSCDCLCHQDTFIARIYRIIIKILSIFGFQCCECSEV